jgi:hypothetical protein
MRKNIVSVKLNIMLSVATMASAEPGNGFIFMASTIRRTHDFSELEAMEGCTGLIGTKC